MEVDELEFVINGPEALIDELTRRLSVFTENDLIQTSKIQNVVKCCQNVVE